MAKAKEQPPEAGAIVPHTPMTLMATALERGVDAETLRGFMDLQERYERNEAAKVYAEAIAGFQSECPTITKTREVKTRDGGRMYMFANYEDIILTVRDLLKKWSIVVTFTVDQVEALLKGTCRIRVGTHFEDSTLSVPVPKGMNTNATQDYGAAVSYLKRFLLCAALNIVVAGEDDDARGLIERITREQVGEINDLLLACDQAGKPIELDKFMDWVTAAGKCEAEHLSDMPASVYPEAVRMLKRKAGVS